MPFKAVHSLFQVMTWLIKSGGK